MANETFVTLNGFLYQDPELRMVGSNQVANLTIVVNARKFNRDKNEWEKKPGKFWRCQAWDQGKMQLAQNVADTLKDKDNVIAYGEIVTREFEQDGKKRSVDEVRIESIGKDLKWHSGGDTQSQGFGQQSDQSHGFGGQQQGGGWNTPASNPSGGWGNPGGNQSEAPF
ncbi:single-stranded DNA-binding protein [Paeniglutamicibacter gangotriensis]|uniref:single-stranded DNA-binding protein n=1 Tax=Paeniglutamicibacter gangotriensis TaxID=254787 RepID=UPI0037C62142